MIRPQNRNFKKIGKWCAALGVLGITIYPIIISPILDPEPYKEIQRHSRMNIDQKSIQPGNMKVWSDPFERKGQNAGKQESS